jgi:tetratricopeptide (TPR) repeat protein
MRKLAALIPLGIATAALAAWTVYSHIHQSPSLVATQILRTFEPGKTYSKLSIHYPLDGTLFPPESVPPSFKWDDPESGADAWLVTLQFPDSPRTMDFLAYTHQWEPKAEDWEAIKRQSLGKMATVTVLGASRSAPNTIRSAARITISTSTDEVGAPLFYREVNLPFAEAVKDPSQIRWRFGSISSPAPPPIVLEHLPVCGNCHSFSRDGQILGMDVDYANSKASYVITHTAENMALATSDIITWDDYKREEGEQTFGLLSQVSPDGKVVVSTVKDMSVFVPRPDLSFSQLFFPIKGILAIYHRDRGTFQALPGADDPAYVQSNASWSPDGKYLVFARAKAYSLEHTVGKGKVLLTPDECREFLKDGKPFLFDLYRVPYNDGKGGKAEPLNGASNNGRSNFFARYSPDGKWIIFCQAKSYMLLQPDSELFIMPAEGGKARRLQCNTTRMNSWHSWSLNSKWLVFSSKANSPYTQLFLTHIDEQGNSSPPVCLANLTAPDRAANIPEFVNLKPNAIAKIKEQFINDVSYVRSGNEFYRANDPDNAIRQYEKALALNPNNPSAHQRLGFLLYNVKHQFPEGIAQLTEALRLEPDNLFAHYDLGMALMHQRRLDEAVPHLSRAVNLLAIDWDKQYCRRVFRSSLGEALLRQGKPVEAAKILAEAVGLEPDNPDANYFLAFALAAQGKINEPVQLCAKAIKLQPSVDTASELHYLLAANYAKGGQFDEAVGEAQKALTIARTAGKAELTRQIEARLEQYRQKQR